MTRILVTSSRMPFALDEIRKFGRQGHEVFATDTFSTAPGSHSRYVEESILTASPRFETEKFVDDVVAVVAEHDIELLVPAFEEAAYLSKSRERLGCPLFAPDFDTFCRLHDKRRFAELAAEIGAGVPRTITATDRTELREAIASFGSYFARAAYSRGGVSLLTNTGPLAGALDPDTVEPTAENPWLVGEFIKGLDLCSFSVAHSGRVAAHSTYIHPRTIEHAGGIAFESLEEPETLALTQQVTEAVGYTGQISIDFMKTDNGMYVIECNPRPTAGVYVMSDEMFVDAVFNPSPRAPRVAPAGQRAKVSVALIRDILVNWREAPADLEQLLSSARDVYAEADDVLPALYQLLSYGRVATYRQHLRTDEHKRTDLIAAYLFDISYDGQDF